MAAINEEIGRIVSNLLTSEQSVFLPDVGSLRIVRSAARRISSSLVQPPFRRVDFSSAEQGIPLPVEIARVARCGAEEAADVYRRWLDRSLDPSSGCLTIEGVGTLFQKSFRPTPAFEQLLNPHGRQPIRMRRPMPWWLWSLITLLIVAAVAAGIFWLDPVSRWPGLFTSGSEPVETTAEQSGEPLPPSDEAAEPIADPTADPAVGPADPAAGSAGAAVPAQAASAAELAQPEPAAPESPAADEIVRTRSGWSYVVLGIYSTEQNARRAIGQASDRHEAVAASDCRVFRYGEKFLVSLGEAESRETAQGLAARYRAAGVADVWVYSKR